jgi:ABC-type Fe3+-siderophore transport system permease subunit
LVRRPPKWLLRVWYRTLDDVFVGFVAAWIALLIVWNLPTERHTLGLLAFLVALVLLFASLLVVRTLIEYAAKESGLTDES